MFKVECESCKAPYQIDERGIPPAGLKMRCPKCGHSFLVHAPGASAGAPAPAPPRPTAPQTAPTRPEVPRIAGARPVIRQTQKTIVGMGEKPGQGGPPPMPAVAKKTMQGLQAHGPSDAGSQLPSD